MVSSLITSASRREWLYVSIVCLVLVVVTTFPYVYGWLTTPAGMRYTGIHYLTPGDTNVYLTMIRGVQEDTHVMRNLYTTEPQRLTYFNVLWYKVGLIAKLFQLDPLVAFHVARVVTAVGFVVVLFFFIRMFFLSTRERIFALCIAVFSSGLGALFGPLIYSPERLLERPIDLWMPESIPFLTLYHTPHLIASLTLIILCVMWMYRAFETQRLRYAGGAALAGGLLAWFHPFNTPTVLMVVGLYMCVLMLSRRRWLWVEFKSFALFVGFMIPPLVYLLALRELDPHIAAWTAQNDLPSPSIWMYVIGFAPLIPFVSIGALKGSMSSEHRRFLILWVLTALFLIYSPVNFQRRMAEGMYIPLALLGSAGMIWVYRKLRHLRGVFALQSALVVLGVVFLPMSNVQILGQDIYSYQNKKTIPYYLQRGEVAALDWLHEHTSKDAKVMSSRYFGNFIPAYSLRYVYIGHGPQTLDLSRKTDEMLAFYNGTWSDDEQYTFLISNGIDYVVVGQKERELGATGFERKDFLKAEVTNADMQVYKVL